MRKLLKNPLNKELNVSFRGEKFILPANGELAVSEELAGFWKRIHGFLVVQDFQEAPMVEVPVNLPEVPVVEVKPLEPEVLKPQKGRPKLK